MMSGCPIIATNKGGNIEQVSSGRNGFLCDNLEDFENYIGCMIKNPSMIKTMGKESIELSKEFSSEHVIKKLVDFIGV